MIHLKYFLQIYPPKIWWIQKSSTFAPAAQPHRGFHGTYGSFCGWLTLKYWRMKRKKAAPEWRVAYYYDVFVMMKQMLTS